MRALAAAAPVLFLFWALAVRRWRGHAAAAGALALAAALAWLAFGVAPGRAALLALHGAAFGLWPVAGIVAAAVLLFELVVATGELEVVKGALAAATPDRRLQALLVAFGLGALLEGAAGFGTPVAIGGAMLAALGFPPVLAAAVALVANTAAVAFGAIGIGIQVAARVTGAEAGEVSAVVARSAPLLSAAVPFLIVTLVAGARRGLAAWPAALATGVAFAAAQGLAATLVGPQLADLAAALAALAALLVLLRAWRPRAVHRFERDPPPPPAAAPPLARVLRAFSPFALLALAVTAWSLPPARALLDAATVVVPIPGLEAAPGAPGPGAAFRLDLLAASGTAVLAAALVSAIALGATGGDARRVLARTAASVRGPVATVALVLAFASVVNGSGMAAELGRVAAAAGPAFPAVSPLLGWLGVVLTGSNTASNALFAPLQAATAAAVAMPPLLAVASNVVGGATAQMVTPASIAVAAAGVPGIHGREGDVLRLTLGRSLALAGAVCLLVWAEARPLAGWLPRPAAARDAAAPPSRRDGALLLSAAAAAAGAIALGARRAGRAPGGPKRRGASAPSENP